MFKNAPEIHVKADGKVYKATLRSFGFASSGPSGSQIPKTYVELNLLSKNDFRRASLNVLVCMTDFDRCCAAAFQACKPLVIQCSEPSTSSGRNTPQSVLTPR
ncbi:MAG: hypothetical protein IT558_06060 [Alphaproteobacteria bacterium]|nr:hypothetical protein [Alphaproteobacteria bacterium]